MDINLTCDACQNMGLHVPPNCWVDTPGLRLLDTPELEDMFMVSTHEAIVVGLGFIRRDEHGN